MKSTAQKRIRGITMGTIAGAFAMVPIVILLLVTRQAQAATIGVPPNFIPGAGLSNGLVGYWTFDGKDVPNGRPNDLSGNANHGNLFNIASSTFYTLGKMGQAFKFDGSDDYVNLPDINAADSSSAITLAGWVKFSSIANNQTITGKYDGTLGFGLQTGNGVCGDGNNALFFIQGSSYVCTSGDVFTRIGVWYHVVATFDNALGTGKHKIYVNGTSYALTNNGTPDSLTATGASTANNQIGRLSSALGRYMSGELDDVRIYNRALSATEVRQLYNLGSATRQSVSPQLTATTSCSTSLSCGLVGYWTFDGKDVPSGRPNDLSGNANHGNLFNIASSTFYTLGKMGQGFNFDGSDDYISLTSSGLRITGSLTLNIWAKADTFKSGTYNNTFFSSTGAATENEADNWLYYFSVDDGTHLLRGFHEYSTGSDEAIVSTAGATTVGSNQWHMYTQVRDTTANTYTFYVNGVQIGNVVSYTNDPTGGSSASAKIGQHSITTTNNWDGVQDDARIYNRALSATEVKQLYSIGSATRQSVSPQLTATTSCSTGLSCGLVGYWTFDGKDVPWTSTTEATALDKSGNVGTGTLTGMSQSVTPSFGKMGQALNFRGNVGEYVQVADADRYSFGNGTTDTPFSLSAWVYYDTIPAAFGNWPIISKWIELGTAEWSLYTSSANDIGSGSTNAVNFQINTSGGTTDRIRVEGRTGLSPGKWYHVVATYDGSSTSAGMKIYLNTVQETTDAAVSGTYVAMSNLSATVDIGGMIRSNTLYDGFSKGKLDDVRIYNRALSTTEIKQLYNVGR